MKFLFFPLNSPGHVNSSLGIADRLHEKGHQTVFMTLGAMMSPETVLKRGHEVIVIEDSSPPPNGLSNSAEKWPAIIERCKEFFQLSPLEGIIKSFPIADSEMQREIVCNDDQYRATIDSIKPDVILIDMYFIPPSIVKGTVPWVRLYSANPLGLLSAPGIPPHFAGFSIPEHIEQLAMSGKYDEIKRPQEWIDFEQAIRKELRPRVAQWNDYLVSRGCSPLPPGKFAHDSPHLNIYMFPESLDYHKLRPDLKHWIRCDSLLRRSVGDWNIPECLASKSDLGGLVYLSMGSLASSDTELMKRLVGFLAHSRNRFIVSKGTKGEEYELPCNMWGQNYLPQDLILQKVDMSIIHGGNNTVTECMYYGCPVIVMPIFADQLDNAQRIQDKRLGIRLDVYKCTQEELLNAVESIMFNQALRKEISDIGARMRTRDDGKRVAGALLILGLAFLGIVNSQTSLEERVQRLKELSDRKPLIKLNAEKFRQFIGSKSIPRNYSFVVMLTALSPSRGCSLCRQAHEEFNVVATSYQYSEFSDSKSLFFGYVDFDEGSEVFNYLKISSAPAFLYFSPKGKVRDAQELNLQRIGFSADVLIKWISEKTNSDIKNMRIVRPPNYTMVVLLTGLALATTAILYFSRNSLGFVFNRTNWAILALVIVFFMTSGQMWNSIRGAPFMQRSKDGLVYISGSSSFQYVAETYIVFGLNAAVTLGMLIVTNSMRAGRTTSLIGGAKQRKIEALVGTIILLFSFSLLMSTFRLYFLNKRDGHNEDKIHHHLSGVSSTSYDGGMIRPVVLNLNPNMQTFSGIIYYQ
ncbi:Tumor suppressor candidate 3, partial [Fragariocoptes setiger]